MATRKRLSDIWEIVSTADTIISISGWGGVVMNILFSAITTIGAYFAGASWLELSVLFFVALSVLLFISFQIIKLKRTRNVQEIRGRYVRSAQDQENELFDFLNDGEQATVDMAKLLPNITKEIVWVGKRMKRYTFRWNLTSSIRKRYKLISSAGDDINRSATNVKNYVEIMRYINQAIRDNYKNFIEKSACITDEDKEALKKRVTAFANTRENAKVCIESMENYRNATKLLMGISKKLTGACHEMYDGAGLLIEELRTYSETCTTLENIAKQKLSKG